MITEIKIRDSKKLRHNYCSTLPAFKNGTTYSFKPGVNLIIGENGCGKTTLMDTIAEFCLCGETMSSQITNWCFAHLFTAETYCSFKPNVKLELNDGIEIKADYSKTFFHFQPDISNDCRTMNDFARTFQIKNSSCGEGKMYSMGVLFQEMFDKNTNLEFPFVKIQKKRDSQEKLPEMEEALLEYYEKNSIGNDKSNEFTILMDEPDRNLSLNNINSLANILNYHKEMTQIIAIVHNPLLIGRLSKNKDINFVEMTDGYLDKIIDNIKKCL